MTCCNSKPLSLPLSFHFKMFVYIQVCIHQNPYICMYVSMYIHIYKFRLIAQLHAYLLAHPYRTLLNSKYASAHSKVCTHIHTKILMFVHPHVLVLEGQCSFKISFVTYSTPDAPLYCADISSYTIYICMFVCTWQLHGTLEVHLLLLLAILYFRFVMCTTVILVVVHFYFILFFFILSTSGLLAVLLGRGKCTCDVHRKNILIHIEIQKKYHVIQLHTYICICTDMNR